jgi:hypothetical protein
MGLNMFSLDLDSDSLYNLQRIFYNIKYFADLVFIRKSANKGFHIKAFLKGILTKEKEKDFREQFGDDGNRIKLDYKVNLEGKPTNTLWTEKNGKFAGKWYEDIFKFGLPFKNSRVRQPNKRVID